MQLQQPQLGVEDQISNLLQGRWMDGFINQVTVSEKQLTLTHYTIASHHQYNSCGIIPDCDKAVIDVLHLDHTLGTFSIYHFSIQGMYFKVIKVDTNFFPLLANRVQRRAKAHKSTVQTEKIF